MADSTAFGPQSPNYTTVRPPADIEVSNGVDTWVKDCTGPTAEDGTVLSAGFFNSFIANLRSLCRKAGVTLDQADDDMIYKAVGKVAEQRYSQVLQLFISSAGNDANDGLTVGSPIATIRRGLVIAKGYRAVAFSMLTDIVALQGAGRVTGQQIAFAPYVGSKTLTIESAAWDEYSDGQRFFLGFNGAMDLYMNNVSVINKITEPTVGAVIRANGGVVALSSNTGSTYTAFSGSVRSFLSSGNLTGVVFDGFKPANNTSAGLLLAGVAYNSDPNAAWPWKSNNTNMIP